jgi:IS5 family transposase
MRRFAGIDMMSERIPDETTILAFRHLLEKHDLGKRIFEAVKAHLKACGMAMKQGTIIDATLIAAPTSTKNKQGERDPEMHQTKKGNQWYYRCAEGFAYGMKVHIGVDAESGLIHSVQTTAANVHDLTAAAELLHVAMRPGQRRVLPDTAEGRPLNLIEMAKAGTASACSSPHQSQRGAPVPSREAAIQISEDKVEGNGEKLLQGACARRADESLLGSPSPWR